LPCRASACSARRGQSSASSVPSRSAGEPTFPEPVGSPGPEAGQKVKGAASVSDMDLKAQGRCLTLPPRVLDRAPDSVAARRTPRALARWRGRSPPTRSNTFNVNVKLSKLRRLVSASTNWFQVKMKGRIAVPASDGSATGKNLRRRLCLHEAWSPRSRDLFSRRCGAPTIQ
jgi:hypothetical protein